MDRRIFKAFRDLVYDRSGIALRNGKESLVSARVGKRLRALGLSEPREYLKRLREDESGEEIVQLLDVISTNVTNFFREADHFDFLAERLREWHDTGQRKFRIWSAASSTGEEPYTIAMTMLDTLPEKEPDAKIMATDISTRVLRQCMQGVYREDKVEPIPRAMRARYFEKHKDSDQVTYSARDILRQHVTFRRLNLSKPPFPMKGPLDVVFCRNVMIYFDNTVRAGLLQEIHRLLKPGGFLMVGHSESLTGMMCRMKSVRPSIYVKE